MSSSAPISTAANTTALSNRTTISDQPLGRSTTQITAATVATNPQKDRWPVLSGGGSTIVDRMSPQIKPIGVAICNERALPIVDRKRKSWQSETDERYATISLAA